jgi:hypothetical protein
VSTANLNDSFVALRDGKFVMIRIPYPMGFYAKGLDGRFDDANAGWKGRGLWSTNGDRTPWLMETGKGSSPRGAHQSPPQSFGALTLSGHPTSESRPNICTNDEDRAFPGGRDICMLPPP